MTDTATTADTQDIVIDEVFPHAPETIWKTLTSGALMARWLMTANGFEPVKGNRFFFQTPADGEWDGVIHCEVLDVVPNERFVYTWKTGQGSGADYVSRLDTVVTWMLSRVDQGTRLRLVHAGFVQPKNEKPFRNISEGWPKVIGKMMALIEEDGAANS